MHACVNDPSKCIKIWNEIFESVRQFDEYTPISKIYATFQIIKTRWDESEQKNDLIPSSKTRGELISALNTIHSLANNKRTTSDETFDLINEVTSLISDIIDQLTDFTQNTLPFARALERNAKSARSHISPLRL